MPQTSVQPPLEFVPPVLNPFLVRTTHALLPYWLKLSTPIADIQTENVERLVDLYRDFQGGKARFLLAFRHPSTYDALCMGYLLSQSVPQVARQKNIALKFPTHAYFLYDRGIPLWAGSAVGWLLPRLGGISLRRGKPDRMSLRTSRELFATGALPLMAAPEGATNGHNEIVSPLEPGIAQMGFWCVEDLLDAGRSEKVFIVPIGIRYRYREAPWSALEQLLTQMEGDTGLHEDTNMDRYQRLNRIGEQLLTQMEQLYTNFYHQDLPELEQPDFNGRLQRLLQVALKVAEQHFDLSPKGSIIDRCRRIEQAGWDCIYREDFKGKPTFSPVAKGLADRVAEEANLRMWHMRLVESFVAVTGAYIRENPTADRFAETALIAAQTIQRMKGDNPFEQPNLGKQEARMVVGQPLLVNQYWDTYQASRQGAKQAVTDLTRELQGSLEDMLI